MRPVGRVGAACFVIVAAFAAPIAVSAAEPAPRPGDRVVLAAPPDETCPPGATFGAQGFEVCSPPAVGNGAGGGINLDPLLPILGGLVLGAGLALVAAYLFLRRRAGPPLDPVDAAEWWTCGNCGRNNVVGSPRCYSCGTWQG